MKLQLQIFVALFLAFALKSNAKDFALLDSEHGISSVEVLEDNIANLEPPDMIGVLAHLKPAREHSKPESDEKPSNDEPGKKSGKPVDDSKSKSRKSKTKKTANGDKMKNKNEKPGQQKSKLPKSNKRKDSKTSEKDGKKVDSDATKDEDKGKAGNSTSEKGGKSEKNPKTAKKSKSKDENTKAKGKESVDKTKDGKSTKKMVGSDSDSARGDKDGKSEDSQKPDSDVTDDKAKMNRDKSESDQSGGKSKKDEKKSVEKFEKPTDDESGGSDGASSKKVDEIPEKIKPDKAKKTKELTVSEAEKASHDVSKDHDDSQAADSKKPKKKKQKDSKKNKRKSKSKKKKAMTEIQKAREEAISNKTPEDSDSETPVNDGSRSYSLESLKHICDVMDEPETAPVSDVSEVDTTMRAFVPILTNKPEMDKSRRRKKKKISAKSKLLFGCEDAKPKDITRFDGRGGITTIYSQASKSRITVYCDNTTLGGGWTVFQRRVDGKLDFDRGYGAYQRGFGELSGEHWLGLDMITNITGKDKYVLRLEMTDAGGKRMIANYGEFSVGSQTKGYRLRIRDFTGIRLLKDVLAIYDGQKFSTFNQDETKSQCGSRLQSGFWFDNCSTSSPNGKYLISSSKSRRPSGIYWKPVAGKFGPITQIEMKFRKKE